MSPTLRVYRLLRATVHQPAYNQRVIGDVDLHVQDTYGLVGTLGNESLPVASQLGRVVQKEVHLAGKLFGEGVQSGFGVHGASEASRVVQKNFDLQIVVVAKALMNDAGLEELHEKYD